MTQPRSLARRALVALAGLAALLVLLVVAAVVLLDSDAVARRAVDLVMPRVSASLGRETTLRSARLDLFPDTRVALEGLTVAGRPGEPALVEIEALRLELALWPLVRSLGSDIQVRSIVLVRPTLALVKGRDGTWSHEGLGAAAGQPAPSAGPASGPAPAFAVHTFRIERAAVRVVDRSQGSDDAGIALSEIDLEATGVGPGLPLDARFAAALASTTQNVHASLSVSKLPDALPATPADWPLVQGQLAIGPLPLDRFRALFPADLSAIVRGGVARLEARLTTSDDRTFRVEGEGRLEDLRLRGRAASGRFRAVATWSPARPGAARVDLADLSLRGPGIDLGGNASLETEPLRAWFVVTGPLLDLDAVMGLLPESEPAPERPAPAGELLPATTRAQLRSAGARGQVAIEEVRSGGLVLTDVKGKVALVGGVLSLDTLDAALFGGRVSAAGTRVDLGEREPAWSLAAKLDGLDLDRALSAFGKASPLQGRLDGGLAVKGAGVDWAAMRDRLDGETSLAMKEGALVTTDLGDEVLGGLQKALAASGQGGGAEKLASAKSGRTTWKDLAAEFKIEKGGLVAKKPLAFQGGFGKVELGGRIGLDGELGLEGRALVPKAALGAQAARLPLPATIDVPLALGGTLSSPRVNVQAEKAVSGAAKGQVDAAKEEARKRADAEAEKAKQEAEKAAKRTLGDVLDRLGGKKK